MRNYYIIGSQGRNGNNEKLDVWEQMRRDECILLGWAKKVDLQPLYGQPEENIVAALARTKEGRKPALAVARFLNLKPGDIVAVKNFAAPKRKKPRLAIHGYAVVRANGGYTYQRRRVPDFPHAINVKFLNVPSQEFEVGGYGSAFHHVTKPEHIRRIFAPVLRNLPKADTIELKQSAQAAPKRRAAVVKSLEEGVRTIQKTFKVTAEHNKFQTKLYQQLVQQHGVENVSMEEDHVDVTLKQGREITLYEVKPHRPALACLREALGQLMLYGWRASAAKGVKVRLVIAGPAPLTSAEADFLRHLQSQFRGKLDYMPLT